MKIVKIKEILSFFLLVVCCYSPLSSNIINVTVYEDGCLFHFDTKTTEHRWNFEIIYLLYKDIA